MATTTEMAGQVTTQVDRSPQRWIPLVAVAAAVVAVAGTAIWSAGRAGPEAVPLSQELVRQQAMSDDALRQELTDQGLIPTASAAVSSELLRQQAMNDAELRQELIERGLIPMPAVAQGTSGADVSGGITPALTNVREAP